MSYRIFRTQELLPDWKKLWALCVAKPIKWQQNQQPPESAVCVLVHASEDDMFDIHLENVGDVAVVQCEGRIVQSDAAFRLRDVIRSQRNCRVVVVDLSEVEEIEGGGLGMLAYLQRWAHAHNIKLKLFNPSTMVHDRLERAWMPQLEVASADEMIALLDRAEGESVAMRH